MADEDKPDESEEPSPSDEQSPESEDESTESDDEQSLDEELDEIIEEEMGESSSGDEKEETPPPEETTSDPEPEDEPDPESGDISEPEDSPDEEFDQEEPADEPSPEELMEQTVGEEAEQPVAPDDEPADEEAKEGEENQAESTPDEPSEQAGDDENDLEENVEPDDEPDSEPPDTEEPDRGSDQVSPPGEGGEGEEADEDVSAAASPDESTAGEVPGEATAAEDIEEESPGAESEDEFEQAEREPADTSPEEGGPEPESSSDELDDEEAEEIAEDDVSDLEEGTEGPEGTGEGEELEDDEKGSVPDEGEESKEEAVEDVSKEELEEEEEEEEEEEIEAVSEESEGEVTSKEGPATESDEEEEPSPDVAEESKETIEESPGDEEDVEGGEDSSIKDMLEEESERAKEEEAEPDTEEEEEEELPEGYVTVEQLPEEEEFTTPYWVRMSAYTLIGLLFFYFCWSYLFLPLWENYHVMQVEESIRSEQFEAAEGYLERGLVLNGLLVHYPDRFVADFLGQMLDDQQFERFREVHQQYENTYADGPRTKQMYTQFLLNRGKWEEALSAAEELQFDPETRGIGYLFHGKASLKLGNVSQARSDLSTAYNWLSDNPALKRLDRDILIEEGNYEQAQTVANQLRNQLAESDDQSLIVRDYIQLARINANLDRHRVTEDMLSQALELEPRNRVALKELSFRYLIQERWESAAPYLAGQRGQSSYRSLYPLDAFGWWGGAELKLSQGSVGQSIPMLERARSLAPRNPEVHRVIGKLHLKHLNDPEQASQNFEKARKHGLQRLQFIELQAQAYYQSGQYQKTVEQYRILRDHLDEAETELLYNLGSAHLGAGNFERAQELLNDAFEKGYVNEAIYNQRGLLRELQGNPVDAQAMYFQGKEWATRNQVQVKLLQSNLDRSLEETPPEPLSDWMAPLDRSINIPYWKQLDPTKSLGHL